MEVADPALFSYSLIIEVTVADEHIVIETRYVRHVK